MSDQETATQQAQTRDRVTRERALDRLLTFVDAVVAIAITLLVLPLVDLVGDVGADTSVSQLLRDHRGQLGAFLLSFLVIANLWVVQHRGLRSVRLEHRRITQLLIGWMLTIVFLPFPTALVASEASDQAATKIVYVGTIALSTTLLCLIELVVRRRPELSDGPPPRLLAAVTALALMLLALAAMLVWPAAGYYPMLLLLLSGPLEALARRRRIG